MERVVLKMVLRDQRKQLLLSSQHFLCRIQLYVCVLGEKNIYIYRGEAFNSDFSLYKELPDNNRFVVINFMIHFELELNFYKSLWF